jgi:putative heme iron utilization protein
MESEGMVDRDRIVKELKAERDRLDEAIAALETSRGPGRRGPGRPPRVKRHFSAAARKRLSEMMKARWAERRKRSKGGG